MLKKYINKNNGNNSASSIMYLKQCGNRCSPLQHITGTPASVTLKVPVTKWWGLGFLTRGEGPISNPLCCQAHGRLLIRGRLAAVGRCQAGREMTACRQSATKPLTLLVAPSLTDPSPKLPMHKEIGPKRFPWQTQRGEGMCCSSASTCSLCEVVTGTQSHDLELFFFFSEIRRLLSSHETKVCSSH